MVNDGVMGGVSEGKFKITDAKTLEFFGILSLENNGGFASVRTKVHKKKLQKELADLDKEARKIKTRLKAIERRRAELTKELGG